MRMKTCDTVMTCDSSPRKAPPLTPLMCPLSVTGAVVDHVALDGTFQMEAVSSVLVANSMRPEGLKQSETT